MLNNDLAIIIATVLTCFAQAGIMNYFLYETCEFKEKSKVSWAILIFSGILESAVILFLVFSHYCILPGLLALIFILYTNILYKDRIRRNVFAIIILSVYFILRSAVTFLFSALKDFVGSHESLGQETFGNGTNLYEYTLLCIQILSLFIVVLILLRLIKKMKGKSFWLSLIVPSVVLFSVISIMVLILSTRVEPITSLCVTILISSLLLLTVLAYTLIYQLGKEQKIKIKEALLLQKEQLVEQNLNEMEIIYNKNRRLRHDLKNANAAVITLMENEHLEEAKELLLDHEKTATENRMFYSKNQALNWLFNTKLSRLSLLGADVKLELMTDLDFIDSPDLCVIFGNLLDNIYDYYRTNEGQEKAASVKAFESQGNVIIEVKNKIFSTILGKNPSLKTTKPESEQHGFGIESVKNRILRYHGYMDISEENGMFTVTAVIPKADE